MLSVNGWSIIASKMSHEYQSPEVRIVPAGDGTYLVTVIGDENLGDIINAFADQTPEGQNLVSIDQRIACAEATQSDQINAGIFASNGSLKTPTLPIYIRSDACLGVPPIAEITPTTLDTLSNEKLVPSTKIVPVRYEISPELILTSCGIGIAALGFLAVWIIRKSQRGLGPISPSEAPLYVDRGVPITVRGVNDVMKVYQGAIRLGLEPNRISTDKNGRLVYRDPDPTIEEMVLTQYPSSIPATTQINPNPTDTELTSVRNPRQAAIFTSNYLARNPDAQLEIGEEYIVDRQRGVSEIVALLGPRRNL